MLFLHLLGFVEPEEMPRAWIRIEDHSTLGKVKINCRVKVNGLEDIIKRLLFEWCSLMGLAKVSSGGQRNGGIMTLQLPGKAR